MLIWNSLPTIQIITYELNTTLGQFFDGNILIGGTLAYRWQPWGRFSINLNYDGIELPESMRLPWAITPVWILHLIILIFHCFGTV